MIAFKRNFSASDWADTPDAVQKEYLRLEQFVLELSKEKERLEELVHQANTKANKNSSNSDKPPSSDSPYLTRTKSHDKEPKGKPRGILLSNGVNPAQRPVTKDTGRSS